MAGVLVQVLVIWGLVLYFAKRKKNNQNPGGSHTPNTTVNTAGTNQNRNNGRPPQNLNPRGGHWGQNIPWPHGGTGASGGMSANQQRPQVSASASRTQTVTQAQEAGEEESTTAYLAKKAAEDAREHAREKWEEEKRLRETRGGLSVAGRHLDGDPIPQGSRCVVCGYCAAENLVPMIPKTRYSCYFCREPLN